MRTHLAAIHVCSSEASLEQISDVLGWDPDSSSCNKGDIRGKGPSKTTVWKLESDVDETAGIADHLAWFRTEFPLERLRDPRLPADRTVYLDIAVMFDTFTCSISLSADLLRPFVEVGAGIEITCYPSTFDSDESIGTSSK